MIKIDMARAFCMAAHNAVKQKRKYTDTPYYLHCYEVVEMVLETAWHEDQVCAAYLHDVVEDTGVQLYQVEIMFGPRVAQYVDYLSDFQTPEDGNRATRKANYIEKIRNAHADVKTIKLADLISNTKSIVQYDKDFAKVYIPEKLALLEVLKEGDAYLYAKAKNLCDEAMKCL